MFVLVNEFLLGVGGAGDAVKGCGTRSCGPLVLTNDVPIERVAKVSQHDLGLRVRFRRIDVDPARIAHVASEEHSSLRKRAYTIGKRTIAVG